MADSTTEQMAQQAKRLAVLAIVAAHEDTGAEPSVSASLMAQDALHASIDALAKRAESAERENAELRRDAERYRFLRAIDNPGPAIFEMKKDGRVAGILVGGHADAAIDSALSSTSTKESGNGL